jgi:hypothetical protein
MKKIFIPFFIATLLSAASAFAGGFSQVLPVENKSHPTLMFGIAVEFGDTIKAADVGLTAKLLSSDRPNTFVFGGGVAYFPWAKEQFGFDIDGGYNFTNAGVLAGYDLLRWKPQISAGYVLTDTGKHCPESYPTLLPTGYCESLIK